MTREAATQFFEEALHKGVLSNAGTRSSLHYDIPIPSMKTFLMEVSGPGISPTVDHGK